MKRSLATLQRPEFQILYVPEGVPPVAAGSLAWEMLKRISAEDKFYS